MDEMMRSENLVPVRYNDRSTGPWAKAIEDAIKHGFAKDEICNDTTTGETKYREFSVEEGIQRVDQSLVYLDKLQVLLERQEDKEVAPLVPTVPPPFLDDPNNDSKIAAVPKASSSNKKKKKKKWAKNTVLPSKSKSRNKRSNLKNRYALLAFDTDDSDSNGDKNKNGDNANDSIIGIDIGKSTHDAGGEDSKPPAVVNIGINIETSLSADADPYFPSLTFGEDQNKGLGSGAQPSTSGNPSHMDTTRLLIRLHTSQCDLHAKKGRLLGVQHRWLHGASSLQSSILALTKGVEIADMAISAIMNTANMTGWSDYDSNGGVPIAPDGVPDVIAIDASGEKRRAQLERDAEITSISSKYLAEEKDRYIRLANAKVARLERILESMWKSRDEAIERMGVDKWKSNTRAPDQSYLTKCRIEYEQELSALDESLEQLKKTEVTAVSLVDEAGQLRERLKHLRFVKNRNNGYRPSRNARRSPRTVSESQPDNPYYFESIAMSYGWKFTGGLGGQDCVLFFEKRVLVGFHQEANPDIREDLSDWSITGYNPTDPDSSNYGGFEGPGQEVEVKLDFYFMTGVVQTVVQYPAVYNSEGIIIQHAWSSTMQFHVNQDDIDSFRHILMDPLLLHSLNGATNVALLHP